MDNQENTPKWKEDLEMFVQKEQQKIEPGLRISKVLKKIVTSINDKTKKEKLKFDIPEILFSGPKYEEKRQISNTKFQFRPAAIFLCQNNQHVQFGIWLADLLNVELRVRSGGHDHEGECSATDAIVIDFSEMNRIEIDKDNGIARIGPGTKFQQLIAAMNQAGVGIPHGTCATVGIAGFTFGGGWGPWTRAKGMGCESLIGATIILGDTTIRHLDLNKDDEENKDLLWALRGGGGMSYGIVTELVFKTFTLPKNTVMFHAIWDHTPALKVLELWERLIASDQNPELIGTNLMIMAKPARPAGQPIEESVHACTFFGYYAGTEQEINAEMDRWFENLPPTERKVSDGKKEKDPAGFSTWDMVYQDDKGKNLLLGRSYKSLKLILPEDDPDAPRKITSRLVQQDGLGDEGRKILIESLESDLLSKAGEKAGIKCYVTLGAISGPYYKDYDALVNDPVGSAFPYKNRPYTIQYQAWWNQGEAGKAAGKKYDVDRYVNQAQDWIEEARQRDFPQTKGSFISFKDSAVPTQEYFLESFERLKQIKIKYSRDPQNKFSSRKTII